MSRFYITTPIYYVNALPHIGHAYTSIACDAAARWHRLCGDDVLFLTGTDEHGQKVLRAAEKLGRTPMEHADLTHVPFKEILARLDVECDDFIRTTEPRHVRVVRAVLARLHRQGEIYAADYSGWYSTSAERFWTDEEVAAASGGTPEDLRAGRVAALCPDSGLPVEWITERNYFFRMSAYQERLVAHIHAHPECIRPESRRNEVLGYLRRPLGDLCISRPRARLGWGIPLPFDEDYVTYVWFDALSNYISALGYDPDVDPKVDPQGASDPRFERFWPADYHVVGKDILTFHTVYWFSMLMALGLPPPRCVLAHGWWTASGAKISKSLGNVVDPGPIADVLGPDAVRYFLLREIPFGMDGEFSLEALETRYNADLANDLGNLAHRSLSMTERWLGGRVPARGPETPTDAAFRELGEGATRTFRTHLDRLEFRQAIEALLEFVRAGNKYVDASEPWRLNREGQLTRLATVLRNVLECCRIAASHLWCVCPRKCGELLGRLGQPAPTLDVSFGGLVDGAPVTVGDPLFPRIERQEPAPVPAPPAPAPLEKKPVSDTIKYDDFAKLALRTGRIVQADRHPNADRLLVLSVDVGEEKPRTIVAGIASAYTPEQLVGHDVVVLVNLEPAKLRGVVSEGMLLAAGGVTPVLLRAAGDAPPGTVVK